MEYIRSLDYDNVGISGGNPDGILSAQESKTLNSINFTVDTYVYWYDDDVDGSAGSGDTNPNDYKKIKVKVSWNGRNPQADFVELYTIISDEQIE